MTNACDKAGAHEIIIGVAPTNSTTDLDQLKKALADEPKESANELWLVLRPAMERSTARKPSLNLRGPDLFGNWTGPR